MQEDEKIYSYLPDNYPLIIQGTGSFGHVFK